MAIEAMDDSFLEGRIRAPRVDVPPEVDRRILAAATPLLRRRPWRFALPLAAAVLVGVAVMFLARRTDHPDVVDAYRVARMLKAGQPISRSYDETGDGRVDERDVQSMMRRAVRVTR